MKQKLFSLLTLALLVSSGAWATDVVWDFTNRSATSFDNGKSYSFLATDGTTEMRYSAGSSDAIVAKDGSKDGYLKENGTTGSGTVKDIDNETNVGKTRLIRLFVTGRGKLTINCNGTNGTYKVLDGSASGTSLIASLSANTQSSAITVTSSLIWIETTKKGYITTIEWSPVSSDPCTVTFDAGSYGTCGTTSLTEASAGAGVTLPAVTGVTSGYKFTGWFTASSGGTKAGVAGDTYYPGSNITLYAQYSTLSTACLLYQAVYSNGFDAFIDETNKTVTVYYLNGQSAPTVTSTELSDDATVDVSDASQIVVTAEDGTTTATYEVTRTAVTPYAEDGMTFNGTESWVKTGYTFNADRGWRFQKNADDGRIPQGLTRLYFFVGHATSVKLINGGVTSTRDVKIYVNGVQQGSTVTVPKNSSSPNYITITCNDAEDNMIAIVSAQIGGDGGFTAIEVTGSEETATGESITPAKEYITYVPTHDLDFTTAAELTAYIATAANASTVTMTPVNKVPAGTPIVIKATAIGSPIAVSKAASTDDVSGNKLKIGDGSTSIGGDGKYDYILSNGKFYHASAGVLPAGKCYLHLDAAPEANELTMDFGEGDVTSISGIEKMRNAENETFFNLAGQRVAQPTKGLYITNGKKVIVK